MTNELRLESVTKKYGEQKALDDVTLTLQSGVYALLRHNGAGKTTMLKVLATLLEPTHGHVLWNGVDIIEMGEDYLDLLGFMPQHQELIPYLSVWDFLQYMATLKGVEKSQQNTLIDGLLEQVNLKEQADKKIRNLSGGMKQRVLIAQALLNDPKILLLDEPTAGLDPVERRSFRELIAEISGDRVVILATHVISDVEWIANQIIIMKKGRILTEQDQAQLIADICVFETYASEEELLAIDPELIVVNKIRWARKCARASCLKIARSRFR